MDTKLLPLSVAAAIALGACGTANGPKSFSENPEIAAAGAQSLSRNDTTCAKVPAGLRSWWPADGATDRVGGNNGTLNGGVRFANGMVGGAFQFNGKGSYVEAPDLGLPFGNSPRTLEFWTKPESYAQVPGRTPVIYGGINPDDAFYVAVIGANACIGQWGGDDLCGATNVADGKWHHVALTYDETSTATLFLDGNVETVWPGKNYFTTSSSGHVYLGSNFAFSGAEDHFAGLVDEVSIYNRSLDGAEIQSIFNAGSLGKCRPGIEAGTPEGQTCVPPPPDLLSWWRANGGSDSAGNNNGKPIDGVRFAPGVVGKAFRFDGVDSYVETPDHGLPMGSAPRTLELWMMPRFNARFPFVYGDIQPESAYYAIVVDDKACIGEWGIGDYCGSTPVTDGKWHHIALTYDGSRARLYVDGRVEVLMDRTYFTNSTGHAYLGSNDVFAASGDWFAGFVDEVSIYGRALAPSEIEAIYNAGDAGKCPAPGQ